MPKQIVVCSDGTWNTVSNEDRGELAPTNVYKTFLALTQAADRTEHDTQRRCVVPGLAVLYDPGVGTGGAFSRFYEGAFGAGLSDNVIDGYEFVAEHYEDGATIHLFGFSRGAFTARSLGGMIAKCGVLPRGDNLREEIERVYEEVYRDPDVSSAEFRLECQDKGVALATPDIEMIGVWDTVGALGVPTSIFHAFNRKLESFHDTKLNDRVKHGYHAVALDEARKAFTPTLWDDRQGIEQVWFAGVHSNIGGGYQDTGLADIALEWMLAKAELHGLTVDRAAISPALTPNFAGELRDSRTGLMKFSSVQQREIPRTGTARHIHGSVLRRIGDRDAAYDSATLRTLQPESVNVADGTGVAPPRDYACRVCRVETTVACGRGTCPVRHKSENPAQSGIFVAATCGHQG